MKVLVFELNSFHLELLPMYRPLLPALLGHSALDIRYFVLPSMVDRARTVVGDRVHPLGAAHLRYVAPSKGLRGTVYRWLIQRLVDREAPAVVIFNTIEPAAYLQTFKRIRHPVRIGIVHNPRRTGIDYTPRGAGELVFCLHEYNYRLLQDKPVDGYFSPFFRYCDVPAARALEGHVEVAVQGVVSFGRRDYPMLVALSERLAQRAPKPQVAFNILGDAGIRDGPRLRRLIAEHGVKEFFRLHEGLSDADFFAQLQRADYVMPLISPRGGSYAQHAKVTAALGHSGAYGTPQILHREVASLWGLPESACVTYERPEELDEILLHGLGERSTQADHYREWVNEKIHRNRVFLEELSERHEALRAIPRAV